MVCPLEFDGVAFGVRDIERRADSRSAVGVDNFSDLNTVLSQVRLYGIAIPRHDLQTEMIHVRCVPVWQAAGFSLEQSRQIHALETKRWKLIRYPGVGEDYLELFNLESDPAELNPVTESYPEVADRMSGVLASWLEGAATSVATPRDQETDLDSLRALGYVN